MKRKILLVLSLVIGMSAIQTGPLAAPTEVHAEIVDEIISGDYGYTVQPDGTASISSYKGAGGELTIPGQLDGYPVTGIGEKVFYDNQDIKKVTLPDSVESIGWLSFSQCKNLETVETGANLKTIGSSAFYDCEKLTSISLHNQLTTIRYEAFSRCTALKKIELPESLEKISDWAFEFSGLETVTLPSKVTEIGRSTFEGCPNLQEFICSDNLQTLEMNVFFDAVQLKKIVLGKNTQMIIPSVYNDYLAFPGRCEWIMPRVEEIVIPDANPYLKNEDHVIYTKDGKTLVYYMTTKTGTDFTVPEGVKTIGTNAFVGNYDLQTVQLANSVTTIQQCAFSGCRNLTSIAISDSVTSIPDGCFKYCTSLSKVNLPSTVKSVGVAAFGKWQKVLTVGGKNTKFAAKAVDKSTTILCAKGSLASKYKARINTRGKHIVYHLGGGVNNAANTYYFTKTFTLKKPTRPGYTFAGWYTNAAKTKKITKVAAGKNYVLYAKWVKKAA